MNPLVAFQAVQFQVQPDSTGPNSDSKDGTRFYLSHTNFKNRNQRHGCQAEREIERRGKQ